MKKTYFKTLEEAPCPVYKTQKIIAGKWKIILLWVLSKRVMRFNELLRIIPEITQSTLTKQLKELVAAGMVNRRAYNEIPPKVEYSLTEKGKDFTKVLDAMHEWGMKHLDIAEDIPEELIDFF